MDFIDQWCTLKPAFIHRPLSWRSIIALYPLWPRMKNVQHRPRDLRLS